MIIPDNRRILPAESLSSLVVGNMIGNCLEKVSHEIYKRKREMSVRIITSKNQLEEVKLYSQHMVQLGQLSDGLKSDGFPQSEINDEIL